jgi:4-hydroxythreonine-4-phosphate dehydrogenase
VCLGDAALFESRARALQLPVRLEAYVPGAVSPVGGDGTLLIEHHALAVPSVAGRPDPANARYVLALLDRAIAGTLAGEFDAIVTAPLHKGVINDAGIPFTGHTEYLAQATKSPRAVMLLIAGELRVALATTHLPLAKVSAAITCDSLTEIGTILAQALRAQFAIAAPHIAVCGLNPHAGEGGHLGDEELKVIAPALARLRAAGINVTGPLPADTVFVPQQLKRYDAVLAMYHDQGLPIVKHVGFERAVNVTLGLPLIRTSPDHGTAFDLAGSGQADARSLLAAVELAGRLAAQRR